mmetsp:Transcript_13972/g.23304  ORF Transcript_13972/g.23304 Transcript_13972/m.23304 type:complete len:337 (-) Transcript_13972:559-1569(-)|eukprot:CAMPEP_0184338904 /NCGR_PEP_ID=MMETSP1089-20130417/7520_1 /TAXON_ID=38269 ORGANISM="Gloeochaete wittrockiana, Strain SAG46.84" /NCGR_SAMPLE_ID=MMETSP1089 /ASSEMBLY_ACC=CAM_ASM_000445 /LENGTH=336 /DNA_ID=CAMNT_0026665769 /DNA_START=18 /DNA_END=1028 /DNA_ORIENTATION=-
MARQDNLHALVLGGTGSQGGLCIDDLISHGWQVRTVTRNTRSSNSIELAKKGVEVMQGNLLDSSSIAKAVEGMDACFAVTISDHNGTEVTQGKILGDALKKAGVKWVVFSGGERIGVDAMDNKADIEDYLRTLDLPWIVYIHAAFFFENIATKRGTKRVKISKDGSQYTFSIPLKKDMPIPFIASSDIGRFAAYILCNRDKFIASQVVPIAGDCISPQQFVDCFSRLTGKSALYEEFSLDFFRTLPIPGAELIVYMYEWYHRGHPGHERDPGATRRMCPAIMDCEGWMRAKGLDLIEQCRYYDDWFHWASQKAMYPLLVGFGMYLRMKQYWKASSV